MALGIQHNVYCPHDDCEDKGNVKEVTVKKVGDRPTPDAAPGLFLDTSMSDEIRCTTCDQTGLVISYAGGDWQTRSFTRSASAQPGVSAVAGGEVVVDSPDGSVCHAGRVMMGGLRSMLLHLEKQHFLMLRGLV